MEKKEKLRIRFGGIDFFGINKSDIKLPDDMPSDGENVELSYIENNLVPSIEKQLRPFAFHKVRPVKYIANQVYVIVDATNRNFEDDLKDDREVDKKKALDDRNRTLYEKWEKALRVMWEKDKENPDKQDEHLDIVDVVENSIRAELNKNKNLVENIKSFLRNGTGEKLSTAAVLCHWTPKNDGDIPKLLARLVLHPNRSVRNNASRSFLANYQGALVTEVAIEKFIKQVQLPFHTDRNKALYVLELYSRVAKYRGILLKQEKLLQAFTRAHMPNIKGPAVAILENIHKGAKNKKIAG